MIEHRNNSSGVASGTNGSRRSLAPALGGHVGAGPAARREPGEAARPRRARVSERQAASGHPCNLRWLLRC